MFQRQEEPIPKVTEVPTPPIDIIDISNVIISTDQIRQVSSKLDLTSIKGYSQKAKTTKQQQMIDKCKLELETALNIFDPHEINLNHSVVLFCSQIVEDIFCKPGQGAIKEGIVIDICKKYFNDEPALVKMVLELVFEKVEKTSLFKRNKERIKNGLGWVVALFGIIEMNFSPSLQL